jgi:hypothetical protein
VVQSFASFIFVWRQQPEEIMSSQTAPSSQIMGWMAVASLAMFSSAIPTMAQSNNANYIFMLASGFLCDPGDSSTCPAIVKSANGDSYEVSGAGTLKTQSKSVTAAGTFTRRASNGNVLETGVWIATDLVSFDSYGVAPRALLQKGSAFGPPLGPKRPPMPSGPMPTGGLAVFHVRFLPMGGESTTAVLQANCALGNVPHERSVEGIRLTLEKNGTDYSLEVSGRVMFLYMRPEVSAPAKTPQQEPAPGSSETPSN